MMTRLDALLDRITMYRLMLYLLIGYVGIAAALAGFGLLPFSPLALLISSAFLVGMCWAANTLLARILDVPTNVESAFITALILALIIDPPCSADDLQLLGWAAILAMSSKYILGINNKHVFNPAAIAVVITAFALGEPASWWVGAAPMLPAVLLGGLLVVRKLRQESMAGAFLAAAVATVVVASIVQHTPLAREVEQLVVASPLLFFASIMLTEPLTAPPTKRLKMLYGLLTGVLIVPQIHLGRLYSTPELALVVGNVFAYLVSSKRRVVLSLKKRSRLSPDIVDFVFIPSQRLAFLPGQYLEATLAHQNPDSRGVRRYFTVASSPTEDTIHLGVRFYERGSSFKRALRAMTNRTRLIGGPIAGDFVLPRDRTHKLVFIAGGVGVTPYRSMLKYLLDTGERRDIVVFFATRTAADIVYQDVLTEAQRRLGIKTIYTLTDTAAIPNNWPGGKGRISEQMIVEAAPDYCERTFYISGPPAMVNATERVLKNLGIGRSQIKRDDFPGLV
jgi:ferredoxin-NADP reductase/Na+-translocating ferredoxin:NAD+ oxidoreductase RnfD subunit